MKKITSLLLLVLFVCFESCAAILSSDHAKLNVDSDPQGARIIVNGEAMGKTPAQLSLDKKKDQTIIFRLDGYENRTAVVASSAGVGWIICDILLGGLIGIVIDAATKSWDVLEKDSIKVTLEKY
ncbi:MAG: PEGA domain-containing protein [Candidatus Kapaibacterium sp.]